MEKQINETKRSRYRVKQVIKLTPQEILSVPSLMEVLVAFNRGEGYKFLNLFDEVYSIEPDDFLEETEGGDYIDFEPFHVTIAKGEYGNCILTLYGENGNLVLDEDYMGINSEVYAEYTYQYKGNLIRYGWVGTLTEEVEFEVEVPKRVVK